jgi:hypothetical protein
MRSDKSGVNFIKSKHQKLLCQQENMVKRVNNINWIAEYAEQRATRPQIVGTMTKINQNAQHGIKTQKKESKHLPQQMPPLLIDQNYIVITVKKTITQKTDVSKRKEMKHQKQKLLQMQQLL